jgi:hypothetical protein
MLTLPLHSLLVLKMASYNAEFLSYHHSEIAVADGLYALYGSKGLQWVGHYTCTAPAQRSMQSGEGIILECRAPFDWVSRHRNAQLSLRSHGVKGFHLHSIVFPEFPRYLVLVLRAVVSG